MKITISSSDLTKAKQLSAHINNMLDGLMETTGFVAVKSSYMKLEEVEELMHPETQLMKGESIFIEEVRGIEPGSEMLDLLAGKLQNGIAHFKYKKKSDGSIREAFGTTASGYIPSDRMKYVGEMLDILGMMRPIIGVLYKEGKLELSATGKQTVQGVNMLIDEMYKAMEAPKKERTKSDGIVTYYDFTAQNWRSFGAAELLEVL